MPCARSRCSLGPDCRSVFLICMELRSALASHRVAARREVDILAGQQAHCNTPRCALQAQERHKTNKHFVGFRIGSDRSHKFARGPHLQDSASPVLDKRSSGQQGTVHAAQASTVSTGTKILICVATSMTPASSESLSSWVGTMASLLQGADN